MDYMAPGYPISDPVYEVLTPGQQPPPVQYFERGRLEYHQDDPIQQIQFGLLGLIKSKDQHFKPNIVMPPKICTPVVLPVVTPIPLPAATVHAAAGRHTNPAPGRDCHAAAGRDGIPRAVTSSAR